MIDNRGLVIGDKAAKSWKARFDEMGGWSNIPNRGCVFNKKGDHGEILIYEQIGKSWWDGSGVSAKDFAKSLKDLGDVKSIDVRINSPGGDVFEADAIYSQLNQHKATKHVFIDGLAASAASYIAMAGDTIAIAEHGKFMIHNAWGMAIGNAKEMRQLAEVLDTIDGTIRLIYQKRTGNTDQKLKDWMEAETWFNAQEAVDNKFASSIIAAKEPEKTAAENSIVDAMRMRLELAKV